MALEVIGLGQEDKWLEVLNTCCGYDFYHCPSYHKISVRNTTNESNLFVYQEGDYLLAIPLIIRPVNEVEGLESVDFYDATSVYGYAGPVASHDTVPEGIIRDFQGALLEHLKANKTICAFSCLHPLLDQKAMLAGLGNVVYTGQTISIDLTLPADEQYSRYRRNHRDNIARLKKLNLCCIKDQPAQHLEEFIDLYHENMRRVNAEEEYFFDETYFREMLAAGDFEMHLFACFLNSKMACGGLFSLCNGIVQAWLAATRSEFLKLAPMKMLIDDVRIWANEVGASCFHLGGGHGAEEDSLFRFKAGFSDTRHEFNIWQLVVLEKEYLEISEERAAWNASRSREPVKCNYFPIYRCPVN